jgi:hypothetical protein
MCSYIEGAIWVKPGRTFADDLDLTMLGDVKEG